MKRKLILVILLILSLKLQAQTDSAGIKRRAAFADARHFKPTKQIRKAYRKRTLTTTSDYFKPTRQTVPDENLLKDSVFVQAYKQTAYTNSVKNIRLNRTIIWGGSVIIAGALAIAIVIIKLVEEFAEAFGKSLI